MAGLTLLALLVLLWIPLPGLPLIHLGGGGWREYWPALLHLQAPGWLAGLREPALAPIVILVGTLGWMLLGILAWPRAPRAVRVWMLLVVGAICCLPWGWIWTSAAVPVRRKSFNTVRWSGCCPCGG
ncbi:hypothetical protein [Zoogloea sp.]|uniref:hypothetical protein n=1 Tax=Zoogloea sp. TaxID=49181 RepID=UPI001D1FFBCC|nr:hypothetical protein [Zoogloea sp.]MBK6653053.1 hypothetical protein [Zoogloea sp.]